MIRSLYLPLIIFWNAATGHPHVSADFVFAMSSPPTLPFQDTGTARKVHSISFVHTCVFVPGSAQMTCVNRRWTMILVTGATGLNGMELLRRLSARGVAVRALVRNPAKAEAIAALPHVQIVQGDMARPVTLAEALHDIDRAMLISSSDPDMLDVQSNFIDAARKAGVKHVVKLSGIMPELDSAFRFARMHGEIEKRLEASGMAFTHLRAGELMPSYFRQVAILAAKGALFFAMENQRIASIDIGDLAEIAALVLTNPGHEGKIYPLTGPEALTMTEVAERLSAATGKKIKYINVSPEDVRKAQLAAGVPAYIADALAELFAERRKGKESQVWPIAQTLLGRRPTSFAEFAARNAAIFRGEQPAPRLSAADEIRRVAQEGSMN